MNLGSGILKQYLYILIVFIVSGGREIFSLPMRGTSQKIFENN